MAADTTGAFWGGFGLGVPTGVAATFVLAFAIGLSTVSRLADEEREAASTPAASFGEMGPRGEMPAAPFIETRAGSVGYLLERDGDAVLMMLSDGQRLWMPIEELEMSCRHAARMLPIRECPQ